MSCDISREQLTDIISRISIEHGLDKDELLSFIPTTEVKSNNNIKVENNKNITMNSNNLCVALVADGSRCTKKSKKNCLCGIHSNSFEKTGKLPYGRYDTTIQTNELKSDADNSKNDKLNNKSNKTNKTSYKNKQDTYIEDSDQEEETKTSNSENKTHLSINDTLNNEIDKYILKLVNQQNFNDNDKLKKLVKDNIFKNEVIKSNFKKNNKIVIQTIDSLLKKRIDYFDKMAKKEFDKLQLTNENNSDLSDDDSSDEEIECTKITFNGNDYLLDENTKLVYNIETHDELGKFNNGLVTFD